jgi:RNA:NAD 2'-phosphotransferase (TPT1/KptA family)
MIVWHGCDERTADQIVEQGVRPGSYVCAHKSTAADYSARRATAAGVSCGIVFRLEVSAADLDDSGGFDAEHMGEAVWRLARTVRAEPIGKVPARSPFDLGPSDERERPRLVLNDPGRQDHRLKPRKPREAR